MDAFKAHLHGTVDCKGGLYCPYDRPTPSSSAGMRRNRARKNRARRLARRLLARGFRYENAE